MPNSDGLVVAYLSRPVGLLAVGSDVPAGARTVSIFVVNRRAEAPDDTRDEAFAFQVNLEISGDTEFLRRPDLRGLASDDWDERVADLQYRDEGEYSVGHNVATEAVREDGVCCKVVRTCWIPDAEVEKVEPAKIPGVEISMDALANLKDGGRCQGQTRPTGGRVSEVDPDGSRQGAKDTCEDDTRRARSWSPEPRSPRTA